MTAQRGVPAVPGCGVIWRVSCIMPMVWGYVAQTKGRASCTGCGVRLCGTDKGACQLYRVWGYVAQTSQRGMPVVPGVGLCGTDKGACQLYQGVGLSGRDTRGVSDVGYTCTRMRGACQLYQGLYYLPVVHVPG